MDELYVDEKTAPWNQKLKIPEVKFPKYVREWELKFEKKHPTIALLNPFYDVAGEGRTDIKARDEGKEFKKEPGYEWRLTQRDYIAICYSRGILAVVDDNAEKSIGTHMEMVMARVLAKNPKLLVCTKKELVNHPWLKTHFHRIYPSFEALERDVESQVARVKKKWGF